MKKQNKERQQDLEEARILDMGPSDGIDHGEIDELDDLEDFEDFEDWDDFDDAPPVPRRYMTEMLNRIIEKMVGDRKFKDLEEVNQFLTENIEPYTLDELIENVAEDPVEVAQMLAFEALEAEDLDEGLDLAKRALALDPDCVDARLIMTIAESSTEEEAIQGIRELIESVEDKWGADFMTENEGHFWKINETRPYMRTRAELCNALRRIGRLDEAMAECRTMLRLNPDDHQEVRDALLGLLLKNQDTQAAQELIHDFAGDEGIVFVWGRALACFQTEGPSVATEKALRCAVDCNRTLFKIMTGRIEKLDPDSSSDEVEETLEAIYCLEFLGEAWGETPGAVDWLFTVKLPKSKRKRRR